jgi:aquaporin NIP
MAMKKYLSEFIGTFILLFVGTGSVIVNQQTNGALGLPGIAAVWGLVIIALIYAFGDISGTHINAAVTLAFAVDKRFAWKEVAPYLGSQLAGALAASALLHFLFPENKTLGITQPLGTDMQSITQSLILEVVMTFILMMVVLRVSVGAKEKGITAGIAIGATVWLLVLFGGPISGTGLNPTRSIAPAIISGNMQSLWIYIVGPITGAQLAVLVHRIIHQE